MYLLYSLLLTLGVIALLPRFIYDASRHGKYVAGFGERMGRVPALEKKGKPVLWLHCVSVGEAQAARPLAREIRRRFPNHTLVVSTTTLTGQRIAREVFRDDAELVFYFPFDWGWTVRRALDRLEPSVVVIMETELWPAFLRECHRRKIKTALVNGRLSQRSFRRYKLVARFISRVVGCLDLALMQTDVDAARLQSLGLAEKRIKVTGNIKFDASTDGDDNALTEGFRKRFHFDDERPLIVAASTHAPEERLLIEAFDELRKTSRAPDARLLLAPRHPERFALTASLLNASSLKWSRRSDVPSANDPSSDAILLDSIGELRAVYPLADVVFVGGSIALTGGHNVLEPAAAGACIVTGAHTSNFAAIMRSLVQANAVIQLPPVREAEAAELLAQTFDGLLSDDQKRSSLGRRARELVERNRGATARTVELLSPLLKA